MGGLEEQEKWRAIAGCRGGGLRRPADRHQGIPHQQYSAGRKLSIILVRSQTNQIEDLLPFVDAILNALKTIRPGQIVAIP